MRSFTSQLENHVRGNPILLRALNKILLDNKEVFKEVLGLSKTLIFYQLMSSKFTLSTMESKDVRQKVYYELMQLIELMYKKMEIE